MSEALRALRALGQSLWLDNLSRTILDDGTLQGYIGAFGITGLTSNPTIFDQAIGSGDAYDAGIREKAASGLSGEALFFELALEDLRRAALLFRPVFDSTEGTDGWVSVELSPLLAHDAAGSIAAAAEIHAQAAIDNLLVKIPGTPAGLEAIEESIFNGIPVNVTLLFSAGQYLAALHAYMRGIERRIVAGRNPEVGSVASLFVSRWDKVANAVLPPPMHNKLGVAMAQRVYRVCREQLASPRWQALAAAGARPQRLLWASTGSKDAQAPDTLYVQALAAPETINTMPEKTLRAFADHGSAPAAMAIDGGPCEATLQRISEAGIDIDVLAANLQSEGAESFVRSWKQLLQRVADKARSGSVAR
ncbi:MAG TPA: transaldolase [Dokdonella sp.]|nr:transaldolase [Dokdonella sp.]